MAKIFTYPTLFPSIGGGNGEEAINLLSGYYTVRYTDNVNPGIGKSTSANMDLVDASGKLTMPQEKKKITPHGDCVKVTDRATVNPVWREGVAVGYRGTNLELKL